MKTLVVCVLLGTAAIARAGGDPFAMLQDQKRTWSFEIVTGRSIGALAPIKDSRLSTTACKIDTVKTMGAITLSEFTCNTNAGTDEAMHLATRATPFLRLAFDSQGVRQVYSYDTEAALADQANVAGFTFPRALVNGRWTTEAKNDRRRVKIAVKQTRMRVAGKSQNVWLSDVKQWDVKSGELVADDAAAYPPGVGLALLCSHDVGKDAQKPAWVCARLTGSTVSP